VVQYVARVFQVPQVGFAVRSNRFTDERRFPFYTRLNPSDQLLCGAQADLCVKYGWRRVATFGSRDAFGTDGLAAFTSAAGTLGVQIVDAEFVDPQETNPAIWEAAVNNLKASGAKVIVARFDKLRGDDKRARAWAGHFGLLQPDIVWRE
jgi:ABC-type branched-subunit amino acid transport system substrate-binding protein